MKISRLRPIQLPARVWKFDHLGTKTRAANWLYSCTFGLRTPASGAATERARYHDVSLSSPFLRKLSAFARRKFDTVCRCNGGALALPMMFGCTRYSNLAHWRWREPSDCKENFSTSTNPAICEGMEIRPSWNQDSSRKPFIIVHSDHAFMEHQRGLEIQVR